SQVTCRLDGRLGWTRWWLSGTSKKTWSSPLSATPKGTIILVDVRLRKQDMKGSKLTTRRTALRLCAAAPAALAQRLHARTKATAFALIGDRYHNSDYIRTGLRRTIEREMDVSIDFCDEVKMLDAETLRGYKLLIVLRDGMLWPGGYQD